MNVALRRNMREVAGKVVIVQSCWLDNDSDIVANIGIGKDGELVHSQRILISAQKITYPYFVPYKRIGPQMTHDEFDAFLNDNFQDVLNLIMSLLEPCELALLENVRFSNARAHQLAFGFREADNGTAVERLKKAYLGEVSK